MRHALLAFATLGLTAGAHAQPGWLVSPGVYATQEADSNTTTPLGYTRTQVSCLQVHDDLQGPLRILTEIALRRDGNLAAQYAAFWLDCTLSISTAATTSRTVSSTFAANHGPDLTVLLSNARVHFPATARTTAPAPFDYQFPFPQVFLYSGQGSVAWEIRVHSLSPVAVAVDCPFGTVRGFHTSIGPRTCQASDQTLPAQISQSFYDNSANVPGTWRHWIGGMRLAKGQSAFWMIGANNLNWGPVPLPFDLTAFGAPGCNVLIEPILFVAGTTHATTGGFNTTPLVFAHDPALTGMPIYGQAMSLDPGNAAFPLVFTDSYLVRVPQLVAPDPASRVFDASSDTALTGTVQPGVAAVTRFAHR